MSTIKLVRASLASCFRSTPVPTSSSTSMNTVSTGRVSSHMTGRSRAKLLVHPQAARLGVQAHCCHQQDAHHQFFHQAWHHEKIRLRRIPLIVASNPISRVTRRSEKGDPLSRWGDDSPLRRFQRSVWQLGDQDAHECRLLTWVQRSGYLYQVPQTESTSKPYWKYSELAKTKMNNFSCTSM